MLWLNVGDNMRCGASGVYEHCKHHRAKMRAGIIEPTQCRKCGAGTRTVCNLCQKCGTRL